MKSTTKGGSKGGPKGPAVSRGGLQGLKKRIVPFAVQPIRDEGVYCLPSDPSDVRTQLGWTDVKANLPTLLKEFPVDPEDPFQVTIGAMHTFIQDYFVTPYTSQGLQSPFAFPSDYLQRDPECRRETITLNPMQRFVSQFLTNSQIDGAVLCAKPGSGKTIAACLTALAATGHAIRGDALVPRPDYAFYLRPDSKPQYMPVIIVVPPKTIAQYVETLEGFVRGGRYYGFTESCIMCFTESDGESCFKQQYIGNVRKGPGGDPVMGTDGYPKYTFDQLDKLAAMEREYAVTKEHHDRLLLTESSSEEERTKNNKEITVTAARIKELKGSIKSQKLRINNKISQVVFVVSTPTFVRRLIQEVNGEKVPSDFVRGVAKYDKRSIESDTEIGNAPPADFWRYEKSLIIIDEAHTLSNEGVGHDALMGALRTYARQVVTGKKTVKVLAMTGTIVFDRIYQGVSVANFLRPMIPFAPNGDEFQKMFVEGNTIVNRYLLKYLLAGARIAYSEGAPLAHPYTINIIMSHEMGTSQMAQYNAYLELDIAQLEAKKLQNRRIIEDEDDETKENTFVRAIAASSCAMPSNPTGFGDGQYIQFLHRAMKVGVDGNTVKTVKDVQDFIKSNSSKIHWVGNHIAAQYSLRGPIFVHSIRVYRGILPLAFLLQAMGYRLITPADLMDPALPPGKRFGIFGGDSLTYFIDQGALPRGTVEEEYRERLRRMINRVENKDGTLCQVVIGNITEGVSFEGISEVHILNPWWNRARRTQVAARGSRFCSHAHLPANRRYIEIYDHINVIGDKKVTEKASNTYFTDRTIDQYIEMVAIRKYAINQQFERLMKEAAVDFELNRYGNYIRLQEYRFQGIESHGVKWDRPLYYNTSEDRYYVFKPDGGEGGDFYRVELDKETYPPRSFRILDMAPVRPDRIDISENDKEHTMVSALFYDRELVSDLTNKEFCDMNFFQLREYALGRGESLEAWDKAAEAMLKNKALAVLLGNGLLLDRNKQMDLQTSIMYQLLESDVESKDPTEREREAAKRTRLKQKLFTAPGLEREKVMRREVNRLLEEAPSTKEVERWRRDVDLYGPKTLEGVLEKLREMV